MSERHDEFTKSNYQGGMMADNENYQVAIDILRCHLGMSAEEARKELGIENGVSALTDTQEALIGLTSEG
ncbi:hypothetical protein [Photobacterium minamisatsumaniensis]|uniref:hypothetical protein n=1 Tax=Photobacterium minamisatsumaniensis TaxID=2910233 RepID=UPI003D1390C8